ncbi:MAG: glycosyltransferase family 9 protein [Elusimicrobiota bacterium]|nr:glycosyltransferase family 9 protein [Elusimicrobiota bacterium]
MKYWIYHYIDRYIGIPLVLLFSFFEKIFKKNKNFKIKKVLVIKLTMMGDTILLYPAVKALKEKFRDAKLTMLCSKVNVDVVKMWDFIDEIIVFKFDKFFNNPLVVFQQILTLWRRKFDLVVDFEQWFRITPIIAFLSGKIKVGFKTPEQFRHYLFDIQVPHKRKKHEVECFCDMVEALGVSVTSKRLYLPVDETAKRRIKDLLESYDIHEKQFVIIHPGCGIHGYYRQWNTEKYAEVAEYIFSNYALKILLTGSKDDLETVKKIIKIAKVNLIDFAGKTTLDELIALVSMAKFVICGNTGVLHIAAAVRTPTIAIHGPTDPAKWGPWGEGHIVVKSNLPCSPCLYLGFEYGCKKRICLNVISVEQVKTQIDKMISISK